MRIIDEGIEERIDPLQVAGDLLHLGQQGHGALPPDKGCRQGFYLPREEELPLLVLRPFALLLGPGILIITILDN